jgi:hypothetical protein
MPGPGAPRTTGAFPGAAPTARPAAPAPFAASLAAPAPVRQAQAPSQAQPPRPAAPPTAAAPSPARRDPFGFGLGAPAPAPTPAPPAPVADDDWGGLELGGEEPAPRASARPAAPELDFDTELSLDLDAEPETSAPAPLELPPEPEQDAELAPMHTFVPPAAETGHQPAPAPGASGDSGEAALRAALSGASREVIEKIVWEVVPQLAEAIIRENLDRLVKDRQG